MQLVASAAYFLPTPAMQLEHSKFAHGNGLTQIGLLPQEGSPDPQGRSMPKMC